MVCVMSSKMEVVSEERDGVCHEFYDGAPPPSLNS